MQPRSHEVTKKTLVFFVFSCFRGRVSQEGSMFSRIAILVAGFCAVVFAQTPQLPPPFATPSADNRPQVIPQPAGARVTVPTGFVVDVAAEGFETPRFMLLGPNQEILMSDSARASQNGGSVYVLLDKDRDGKIEQKTKIIEKLDRPYGLALWKDYLYVA